MPLKTYTNLPEKRKKEILDACYEEFALNSYSAASLSGIIRRLGLAKGSFYRYFSSKRDLYYYLLKTATADRLGNVEDMLASEERSLSDKLIENFRLKVKFDLEFPLKGGFLYNVLKEKNNEEIGDVELIVKNEIMELIKKIMKIHVARGEIRTDIDIDYVSFMIMQVQIGIYEYIERKFGLDFGKNIREKRLVFTMSEEEIMNIVKSFATLLEYGYCRQFKR